LAISNWQLGKKSGSCDCAEIEVKRLLGVAAASLLALILANC
jgi:hypothetical protein